jgi:hypothetical protein
MKKAASAAMVLEHISERVAEALAGQKRKKEASKKA